MAAALSYEEEQEQLHREAEGLKDFHIEVPKAPEVDPVFYKDVESMLFRGFIVAHATIDGVRFTFKSLNQHEFSMLRFIVGEATTNPFWDAFLAWGVFIVNGVNILADRERHLPEVEATFSAMPRTARDRIIRHLSELNRRASVAVTMAEPYATENHSRYRWAQLRGMDLTHPCVTGIPGTERLGMNWAQLVWRSINYFEDQRDASERDWENAKFVGACMAGKGIQKVYHRDEERLSRKDAVLRHALLGEDIQQDIQKYGVPLTIARTDEELIEQVEKSLRGEKDFHDLVVEAHDRFTKERALEQKRALKEMIDKHESAFDGRMLQGTTDLRGLTADQVRDLMEKRRTVQAQNDARRMVFPELLDEKGAAFAKKWGLDDEEEPNANTPVMPVDSALPPRTPRFRR
jgi:hypothetical protein